MADARVPLDDAGVRVRVARLDELLERLEALPGPTTALALETVETLAAIYGEALARIMDLAASVPGLPQALADDELVGHLLLLHDLHPASLEERVLGAVEEVRPYVQSPGGDVELAGIEDGVARIRLSGGCSACSGATIESAVEDAVLEAAPELLAVESVRDTVSHATAFVPLSSLRLVTAPRGGPP